MSEEHPQDPPSAPERGPPGHHSAHSQLPKFTFLEELKRRNVGRVAILYIILGYVVLEIFGVFVHLLDLPPWVGRSAVLLVVLGFPVALLIIKGDPLLTKLVPDARYKAFLHKMNLPE